MERLVQQLELTFIIVASFCTREGEFFFLTENVIDFFAPFRAIFFSCLRAPFARPALRQFFLWLHEPNTKLYGITARDLSGFAGANALSVRRNSDGQRNPNGWRESNTASARA